VLSESVPAGTQPSNSSLPNEEQPPIDDSTTQPAAREQDLSSEEISGLLLLLEIEPENLDPYDRNLFSHWVDVDGDGCNSRREVLIAEALEAPIIAEECELIGGLWYSAYDGVITDEDSGLDVDHMVPLSEAWDSGANSWSADKREAFANDLELPEALIAVSAASNRSKGDKDPADWLPSLQSYRCQYVQDWIKVKVKWKLSVDQKEFSAIRSLLATC
jgi:hypothetical protein